MIKFPLQLPTYSLLNVGWPQTNRSDILGALWSSFNIDLNSNVGKIRGTRMLQTTSQHGTYGAATNSSLTGVPVGFRVFTDSGVTKVFTVAGSKVHSNSTATPFSSFNVDADTSTPLDCDSTLSDIEVFNNSLYVTGNSKLYKNGGSGSWSNTAFSGGGPWPMTVYAGRLYIGVSGLGQIYSTADGSTIATPTAQYAFSFSDLISRITFLRSSSNRIWIGTVNQSGKGYVHEWDGSAANLTKSYRLQSVGVLACVIKDDVPWIMDTDGKLFQYTNGTFKEVARLPLRQKYLINANSVTNNRFIHPNGMTIIDGRINILINNLVNDIAGSIVENIPSGIWEFDDITNSLYHKYSLSYTAVGGTTVQDHGQYRISAVGALSDLKNATNATSSTNFTGNLIAGATIFTDASTTDVGIFTNDTFEAVTGSNQTTQKGSYFITEKLSGKFIQEAWQKIYLKYRQFEDSGDKIIVKYRTTEADPTDISITWTSTTTFTTTTDIRSYFDYVNNVGGEVEITQGTGSGKCAHITKIDLTSGTYTVTLDETFTGVTGTAKARFQSWIKVQKTVTDQVSQVNDFSIGKISSWLQLKICFISKDRDEIESLFVLSNPHQNN